MKVTLITARMRFDTAGGVTATETRTGDGYASPLRRAPDGKIHLPGTTVAGSLRAHCARHDGALDALFGNKPPTRSSDRRADAIPSAIQVLGTALRPAGESVTHRRSAIDRERGAARTHHYYEVELLPAGTEFDVFLRWDDPDAPLRDRFLAALTGWHPMLGRGVTRGAGRCSLIGWGEAEYDLSTGPGLLSWIRDTDIQSYPEPTKPVDTPEPEIALRAELSIVDAVHCGTGDAQDNLLPTFRLRTDGDYAIPGSTLKGVLRSRAEYICRVVGAGACTDQSCGECRPCTLFGHANAAGGRRGRIAVDDAVIREPVIAHRNHVAIDRFTGGARDTALYTHEVVASGTFTLHVRALDAIDEADERLLHAVLADLHDGYTGIGARTTAGYGTVAARTGLRTDLPLTDLATAL
ncbi:RAMP superfamily CRISPR-associated protein [Saccharopolyspora sp. 7B]|uniref:RAMP superfamily CRISPR-associated protein n=1 Tax=Saccharopolyspora sp. 7B TaxID=2877240 RepID=UPI001CD549A4|nr:RAMP superfamily CRISPR-associated protein [Saccharopolyspora sp. 7B]MCA1278257.1 RAMP superfamily CRISPR-associated protein [Saccharopolyspora sp. 7B]